MNPRTGLARLRTPRSNMATNLLFATTFVVFALIAETAVDQQRREIVVTSAAPEAPSARALGPASMPTLDLRDLVRPYF